MNFFKIFEKIEDRHLNEAVLDVVADRRSAISKAGELGLKVALASMPLAFALMPKAARGQSNTAKEVLNFALTLEYLEDEFYKMGLGAAGLIPTEDRPIFQQISKHETAHVAFLKGALGGDAVAKPNFDFTAGGAFADVFTNYETFAALAQAFEDTGVRAYKGQAGNLFNDKPFLTAALRIHSVEARHASEVRRLRMAKAWITGDTGAENGGLPSVTDAVYAGENNVTHLMIDVTAITDAPDEAVRRAWDEPLAKQAVLDIAGLFIA